MIRTGPTIGSSRSVIVSSHSGRIAVPWTGHCGRHAHAFGSEQPRRPRARQPGRRREARTDDDHRDGGEEGAEAYREEPTRVVERAPEGDRSPRGDGLKEFLTVVYRIARLVFFLLALVVILGIVFVLAPTNADNVIVENVLELADTVAGPFRDVFTADDAEREMVINYGLAAAMYLLAAFLMTKLPGGKR